MRALETIDYLVVTYGIRVVAASGAVRTAEDTGMSAFSAGGQKTVTVIRHGASATYEVVES
jgi:hypothetical protein